jgi:purine-binding chemotaxis protein CheW
MAQQTEEKSGSFLVSTFHVGDTLLGIDTLRVQEIIRVSDVTSVHHAPEYVQGVINLRGKIVTVLDLSRKLDFPPAKIGDGSRVIIVDDEDEYVGLLVDSISDVIVAERERVIPSPANVEGAQKRFFQGVYQGDQGLIAVLDAEEVLSLGEK